VKRKGLTSGGEEDKAPYVYKGRVPKMAGRKRVEG